MENLGQAIAGMGFLFFVLIVWSFVWKALALWHAARRGEKGWYIALLIVNTLGILEILYLYVFGKDKNATDAPSMQNKN